MNEYTITRKNNKDTLDLEIIKEESSLAKDKHILAKCSQEEDAELIIKALYFLWRSESHRKRGHVAKQHLRSCILNERGGPGYTSIIRRIGDMSEEEAGEWYRLIRSIKQDSESRGERRGRRLPRRF